ncbi:MAG: hypothetical protein JWM11_2 [Planctomycetaceae bacterium]|nr:hypothetical protein [Planctomycetaceae bacterium]
MFGWHRVIGICCVLSLLFAAGPSAYAAQLRCQPPSIRIDRPERSQQLLVSLPGPDGSWRDVSRRVRFTVLPSNLAQVDSQGLVRPVTEGVGELEIRLDDQVLRVPLEIVGQLAPVPVSFRHEVLPILTKAGCNMGGCHGKAEGQNGFKLSVFGFDSQADHLALVQESRGRRVNLTSPESSLLLRKGAAIVPHGGGRKLELGDARYLRLLRWVQEGARFEVPEESPVVGIEIDPTERILSPSDTQQLRVSAIDATGRKYCVTAEAEFVSNAPAIAVVDSKGLIQATNIPGEAAILARYLGHVAICRVTIPRSGVKFQRPPENNFIDGLVWNKLDRLGIEPSLLADDATFLRRVFLDTIGRLPTSQEAREFLASPATDKRAQLIDNLLKRPEYAEYWTMLWSDLLRIDQQTITPEGAVAATRWLKKQFVENRPYDAMVREILTVQGGALAESPAPIYKAMLEPEVLSRSVSQVFLGVRIECAQCHHHPFERWSQDDYFGLAGFFTGLTRKNIPNRGEVLLSRGGTDLKHPRTGVVIPARALGAPSADFKNVTDRRIALANWMTAPDNKFFAPALVNRLWAHYLGRGLVEPIDDLRETNPPTNGPLFDALAKHLKDLKYDQKAFTRTLLNSRVYQLSGTPVGSNADDRQNFSHAYDKALPAEVLLDSVCNVTGVPEKFNGWPLGYRSVQLWDSRVPSYFFRIFGRPVRNTVCECERSNEPSISQALHLLNSPELSGKLHHPDGTVKRWAATISDDNTLVDELYLAALSRFPTEQERQLTRTHLTNNSQSRRTAAEDILWALLNSKEFLYNH